MTRVIGIKSHVEYSLAPWSILGQGGEGCVYSSNDRGVKVFSKPLAPEQAEKFEALERLAPNVPGFAWPIELVVDSVTQRAVGFVMELVTGKSLDSLLAYRETTDLPPNVKVSLALQVARAVDAAHKHQGPRVVLGDVLKAANLVVDVDSVSAVFVDAASVSLFGFRVASGQVRDSWSWLKTPGYVPKEELDHPGAIPSHDADRFALAVLLFELFFGVPPHQPKPHRTAVALDPDDAVRNGSFFRYVRHREHVAPTYDPIDVPADIDDLFRAAFLVSAIRPKAETWCVELQKWLDAITPEPEPDVVVPPPEPPRTMRSRLAEHPYLFAILAWSIVWLVQMALDLFAPGVAKSVPLPTRMIGPGLFRGLFP
ncbi:MAG: hypothetical protein GC190_20090 [Alphaproteobacteria bacterium]|nr:hypothetical protein [Alphaproteobacteria bacterium]